MPKTIKARMYSLEIGGGKLGRMAAELGDMPISSALYNRGRTTQEGFVPLNNYGSHTKEAL